MRITIREKILLMILGIAALIYLTFTYVITPNFEEKDALTIQRTDLQSQLDRLNNAKKVESELDESIGGQYKLIDDIAVNYFNTTNQEELILLSNDLFDVEDIVASGISYPMPSIEPVLETEFLKTNIDIAFEGDYKVLMNILDTVWAFPKYMQVESLNLSTVEIIGELQAPNTIYTEVGEGAPVEEGVTEDLVTPETDGVATVNNSDNNEPQVIVSGSISIKLMNVLVDSNVVDNLYTWYLDEQYVKENPFIPYAQNNSTIRYIYTGAGANLFNFDRFKDFVDINGHWMEAEIRAFLEEGYIYTNNNNTFNPDQPISRGEFVVLLDSVYEWSGDVEETVDITKFSDYATLDNLEESFAKAIRKGIQRSYILGYDNNTLALSAPITYSEVELVMQRIQENEGFAWGDVAKSITDTKGITSSRWNDKNQGVTKAEAVYLLTNFR